MTKSIFVQCRTLGKQTMEGKKLPIIAQRGDKHRLPWSGFSPAASLSSLSSHMCGKQDPLCVRVHACACACARLLPQPRSPPFLLLCTAGRPVHPPWSPSLSRSRLSSPLVPPPRSLLTAPLQPVLLPEERRWPASFSSLLQAQAWARPALEASGPPLPAHGLLLLQDSHQPPSLQRACPTPQAPPYPRGTPTGQLCSLRGATGPLCPLASEPRPGCSDYHLTSGSAQFLAPDGSSVCIS